LEVFIPDGQQVILNCQLDDSSDAVLKKFGRAFNISPQNLSHFGLFLTRDRFKEEGRTEKNVFDQMCTQFLDYMQT
jgi:hypothetical protein